jgi:hypothetical protein
MTVERDDAADETLADRLRGHGVRWDPLDVTMAVRRLAALFGDDALAEGDAVHMLDLLARRPMHSRVKDLSRWLGGFDDATLLTLVEVPARHRRKAPGGPSTLGTSERAARARARLDAHPLGDAARAEAAAVLAIEKPTAARIDLEALQLLTDLEWCDEQRTRRLDQEAS